LTASSFSPRHDKGKRHHNAAKVRKVRHLPTPIHKKSKATQQKHQVLGLYWYGREEQHHFHIRESHAKTQQNSINGARGAHQDPKSPSHEAQGDEPTK